MSASPRSHKPGSLDSLLDTMTNVIGILIVIMALVQLGVGDAVRAALHDTDAPLASATDDAYVAARAELAELQRALDDAHARFAELEPAAPGRQASLLRIRRAIDDLDRRIADHTAADLSRPQLESVIAERIGESNRLAAELRRAEAELARLRAIDQHTPLRVEPTHTVLHLPNPRVAPPNFTPLPIICRDGRIYPIDVPGLQRIARAAVQSSGARTDADGRFDCADLVAAFSAHPRGDRLFNLRLEVHHFTPYLALQRRPDAGETRDRLVEHDSDYLRLLASLGSRRYLQFFVWPDSFDTYLAARDVADRLDIPAGWEPRETADEWKLRLAAGVVCIGYQPPTHPLPQPPDPNGRRVKPGPLARPPAPTPSPTGPDPQPD